jgi:pimeloyl-ACP methyl ester carboxylesterase
MVKQILTFCFIFLVTSVVTSQDQAAIKETAPFTLPKPSGKYQVGRSWVSLKDTEREDREVPVFIYYPVQTGQALQFIIPTEGWRQEYLPILQKKLGATAGQALAFSKGHFAENGVAVRNKKFPLLLFSHGLGWSTLEYSAIIHELVSAGYIVAAVNSSPLAPVLQASTGKFLTATAPKDKYQLAADDLLFVLQEIKKNNALIPVIDKHANLKQIGVGGHSLGGAAAILAASVAPEIKAAVNMDGDMMDASMKAAPKGSVLFLNQIPSAFENRSFDEMIKDQSIGWRYQQMNNTTANVSGGMYISIAGMYHSNFQDYALMPDGWITENIRKARLGPIDGKSCLQLITNTLITYFDQELKGKRADWKSLEKDHKIMRVIDLKP